jgi:hypothetical protein
MALTLRAAAIAAALAGTTILAAPASAAPLAGAPVQVVPSITPDFSRYDPAADVADWRRCRWGCGWGRGWGGGWGHRGWRRNRIDGGDVLIGAAIIGGAIAIANANRRQRDRDVVVVDRDPRIRDDGWNRDTRYRDDRRAAPRGAGASGLDNAVNMCLDRIERDVRVDTVDNVERTASGWQVSGALFNGTGFRCRIGNSGQIDAVDYDGSFGAGDWREPQAALAPAPGQLSDQSYAALRAQVGGSVRPDLAVSEVGASSPAVRQAGVPAVAASAMPAYPGGPIPGEVIPETLEEANGG